MSKLYVGNLPYTMNEADLGSLFSQAGTVASATVITDKMSGRSRGFGFVEMGSAEEAQAAISQFDGKEIEGRKLVVNEARPMQERGPRKPGGFQRRGPREDRY